MARLASLKQKAIRSDKILEQNKEGSQVRVLVLYILYISDVFQLSQSMDSICNA